MSFRSTVCLLSFMLLCVSACGSEIDSAGLGGNDVLGSSDTAFDAASEDSASEAAPGEASSEVDSSALPTDADKVEVHEDAAPLDASSDTHDAALDVLIDASDAHDAALDIAETSDASSDTAPEAVSDAAPDAVADVDPYPCVVNGPCPYNGKTCGPPPQLTCLEPCGWTAPGNICVPDAH